MCFVVHDDGSKQVHFDRATVEGLLAGGRFFWLDLDQPAEADFEILRDVFGFHPLAVEDSEHFDQRAKLDDYDDFIFIVVYGATPDEDQLVEVHCFYSERFLVTVHHDDCPAFAEIRRRYRDRDMAIDRPSLLLYRVVDGLVDSFFPILGAFDDRIDELEDQIFLRARRPAAAGDLPDEATARRDAQGGHPAARHVRESDGTCRRAARTGRTRTSATSATSTTT